MNSFAFLFEAMKETHEQHKTKIDINELITGPTNITYVVRAWISVQEAHYSMWLPIFPTYIQVLIAQGSQLVSPSPPTPWALMSRKDNEICDVLER
jgi:hypothetical protein